MKKQDKDNNKRRDTRVYKRDKGNGRIIGHNKENYHGLTQKTCPHQSRVGIKLWSFSVRIWIWTTIFINQWCQEKEQTINNLCCLTHNLKRSPLDTSSDDQNRTSVSLMLGTLWYHSIQYTRREFKYSTPSYEWPSRQFSHHFENAQIKCEKMENLRKESSYVA